MHYNISTVGLCAAKVAVRNTVRLLSYTKGGKHLGVVDVYTKIPYDLSGSISKNRFRQELCWGISKMFDLFDKEDFCVVFDYKCDIEIHFNDSIEFYQIKTHKIQSPYKFSNLKRHKDGPSIIAKLFVLKDTSSPDVPIRCAIVSNAFLQIGKVAISDKESFSFEELDEKSQSAVKAALTEELVRENVDLSNLYYIYTPMNLFAPQNDIIGKITGSFERIKGCEPVKPNALYRLIVDTVTEKACYELSSQDYSELIRCKGITKAELNTIDLRIKKYSTGDDIILLSSDMQYSIMEIDRKISEYEAEYSQWLSKLRKYEESINIASTEINDILKHEGFIDIKESVAEDLDTIRNSISENEKKLREVKKSLRKYGEIKKKINERYYALMLSDKNRFGLEGINAKSFENIKRTFSAGGSNNPLSTIIWYVNLIQLKHEFNPSAIDFPVVFDSPNNAETDETKKRQIYSYICERITENQLIVSGLGFSGDEILDSFDSIITLTNNKYELLCQKDYDANVSLLRELNNK